MSSLTAKLKTRTVSLQDSALETKKKHKNVRKKYINAFRLTVLKKTEKL